MRSRTAPRPHVGKWWATLPDGRVQCNLCPRHCKLRDGQRGFCFVRQNIGGELVLDTYGRSSGFAIDPIEKKPLNHFLPGTSVFSFGTAGCNLACKFCQNWTISTSREFDSLGQEASPTQIALSAHSLGCASVAFTYNDPIIFAEYAMDSANECLKHGINPVAVTAGYISPEARGDFFSPMRAANVDLKGFTDEFYRKVTGARLQTVLDTIEHVNASDCWLGITTLLIPGKNDDEGEIREMSQWIVETLGPDVPHHFSAFHPSHRMRDVPPTPPSTLRKAREIAMGEGENYVYTGNIHDPGGQSTICPGCSLTVVCRDRYRVTENVLVNNGHDGGGACPRCRTVIPGIWS